MTITADDIHNQSFSIDRKGYDVDEVDVFLEHVADEIDALNNLVASLEDQLDDSRFDGFDTVAIEVEDDEPVIVDDSAASELEAALAEKDELIADLNRQLEEKKVNDNAISQALIIAQRSADDILARANAQAAETIQDARDEATRILKRANDDKQAVLESIRKLEDDREDVREEYQDILKDFIVDATRKLSEIGGTPPGAHAQPAAYVPMQAAGYAPAQPVVEMIDSRVDTYDNYASEPVFNYTTPQASEAVIAAAAPVASAIEKDLSGFGDADDFEFEEVD